MESSLSLSSKCNKSWRLKNPDKYKAHIDVGIALNNGVLKRDNCEKCNTTKRTEAHHEDYSKPLEVIWLCSYCHKKLHLNKQGKKIRARGTKYKIRNKNARKTRFGNTYNDKKPELKPKAEQLRSIGKSYKQIAVTLGISKGTAYKWLNNVNYE